MNIETMIYAYLAVCAAMILFNCVCIFVFRARGRDQQRRGARLEQDMEIQFQRLRDGLSVENRHKALLRKKLPYTRNLLIFDQTLERLTRQSPADVETYLGEVCALFAYLAVDNRYNSAIKLTYFAYVVKKYRIIQGKPVHAILDIVFRLLREPSLYCREHALQVIYSVGDCDLVLRALHTVDDHNRFHHRKLLTDGLLSFPGDREHLANRLWEEFETFTVPLQAVILDYFRFSGNGSLQHQLLGLLADERQDDELRFSCIRYFGRYPCQEAFPLLVEFVSHSRKLRWEYAAIAASSLASYPGERTVEVLKRALSHPNWYIRFNAAKSLERFDLSYLELSDVTEGGDRYAREIMQYCLDLKTARRDREEALV